MTDGPASPEQLLKVLAAAEQAIVPRRESFYVSRAMGGATILHPGIADGELGLRSDQDLEDLVESGLVRVLNYNDHGRVSQLDVTTEGAKRARVLTTAAAPGGQPQGSLDWASDVLPVVSAVYAAYPQRAPGMGVSQGQINDVLGRPHNDDATDRILYELVRTGFVRATVDTDQDLGPAMCELTEKALRLVAGWPSPEQGGEALLTAIAAQIEDAVTPEERSRWQRVYDAVREVGERVFVEVAARAITREI